ncbi:MAG: hypothetical protein MEP57_05925 [Microvirga sp.]|nr:hypothetical protein [Microvirga sp.]
MPIDLIENLSKNECRAIAVGANAGVARTDGAPSVPAALRPVSTLEFEECFQMGVGRDIPSTFIVIGYRLVFINHE